MRPDGVMDVRRVGRTVLVGIHLIEPNELYPLACGRTYHILSLTEPSLRTLLSTRFKDEKILGTVAPPR